MLQEKKLVNLFDYIPPHKSENNDTFILVFYFHCNQLKPIWLLVFYQPKKEREGFPHSPQSFEEHPPTTSDSALSFP